jgi:hypothetical protein
VRAGLFPPVADKFSIQTECQNAPLNISGFDEVIRIAGRCCGSAPPSLKASPRLENRTAAWELEHSAYGRSWAADNLKPSGPL